eukprot:CAMPEP_0116571908 /NCGR_PEP_ID=MMETSP0397-20121206/17856_1 /TAXON_ID=216820 /ORGANISM="Cyclophora tenuis, Strain ECT3854" /LENGTH=62 /DNA_ID=CAMNT_0004100127 /DNA_START=54 /DNA_END=246 /DNA_ORIENTATION=+
MNEDPDGDIGMVDQGTKISILKVNVDGFEPDVAEKSLASDLAEDVLLEITGQGDNTDCKKIG